MTKNKKKIIKKSLKLNHFKRKKKESKSTRTFLYDLPSRKTVEASHCSLSFLVVLIFASIVVLILNIYLFAIPILSTNNFRDTMCRVQGYNFIGFESCECGGLTNANPYCKSQFPCGHVIVDYNIHTVVASNSTQRSVIYQDESVLSATSYNCSFATCKESKKQNIIELESFKSNFGNIGSVYECMYNRGNTKEVIIKRRYGLITLVLSLALPSLTLLVSAFLFFIICKTTGHSQIKQLRIKSTRSYIKKGVKLPNGQRTTSNDAQIQHQQALESQHSSVPSSGHIHRVIEIPKITKASTPENKLTLVEKKRKLNKTQRIKRTNSL